MNIFRINKIPIVYTQLPFLRKSPPIVWADCPQDLHLINKMKNIIDNSACVSVLESSHEIILRADVDDNIINCLGETNEVIKWQYYYYKPWDVEYLITKEKPAEAVLLKEIGIDDDYINRLSKRISCIEFLKNAEILFKNPHNNGYKIDDKILNGIMEIEEKLFASYDMDKFKGISNIVTKNKKTTGTLKQREFILQRDSYKCIFCGATAADTKLEINHIIPKSLIKKMNLNSELKTATYNLCTTCFQCNRGKKDVLSIIDIDFYLNKFSKIDDFSAIIKYLKNIRNIQNM